MNKLLGQLPILLLILLFFAACKSQKQISKTTSPIVEPDSLNIAKDSLDIGGPTAVEDSIEMATVIINNDSLVVAKKDTIIITGVGDIMLGTNFPEAHYLPANEGKDMLAGVEEIFKDSDIVFGNLEGVLLDSAGTQKKCRNPKICYLFRSPEYMGARLQEAGFNLLSIANNHAGDFGAEGRINTAKVLDSLQVNFAGSEERPYTVFDKEGVIYGFAAFSPNKGTPNINDIIAAKETVTLLDSLADIVIVSFHGGAEGKDYTAVIKEHEYFYGEDRGDVYNFAHSMVDAGADIILGHGPHVPRAIDVYKNRFIAYSLGNFATYARFNLRGVNGLAPVVKIMVDPEGRFLQGQIISCKQTGWGVPELDSQNSANELIRNLTKKDFPEVKISIDESGFISYLHH